MLHGLPLAYNTDLREDKRYLFDAVDCLDALLPVVHGLLAGVTFDEARMAAACDPFLVATDVADYLVASRRAVPRGAPPHRCAGAPLPRAGRRPRATCRLDELAALAPACSTTATARARTSRARALARKRSRGGSAPERVREQLAWPRALAGTPVREDARGAVASEP